MVAVVVFVVDAGQADVVRLPLGANSVWRPQLHHYRRHGINRATAKRGVPFSTLPSELSVSVNSEEWPWEKWVPGRYRVPPASVV